MMFALALGLGVRTGPPPPPPGYAYVVHNGEPVISNGQNVIARIA